MNTLTAPLRQQTPAAAQDCDVGALEAALARNGRRLRFEPALERAYERDTGTARTWRHVVCNLLGVASFCFLSEVDLARLEGSGAPLAAFRTGVIAASVLVIALLWCFCRTGRGRLREVTTTLGTLSLAAYAIVAARYLSDAQALMQGSGLLLIVDHFKRYNDRHGHPAGDACLTAIGAALAAVAARHGGLAARIGGEEFALLLPGHDADRAAAVAVEVCEAVRARRLPHDDSPVARQVSVSVGAAASVPGPGIWASTLVGAADAALYAAKRRGRDRCVRFDASLAPAASPRVRSSSDPLPPDAQAPANDIAAIDRLSGLLRGRLGWLRFPADIECEFQERDAPERRRQLAFLVTGGLAMTLVYVALCRPVFPDIADTLLRDLLALSITALGLVALNLKMRFGWRVREGMVAASIGVLGLSIVWIESQSRAPTVYSATLGLCLLPMFSSLVAAQPLRFCLVPALLICAGIATVMAPAEPERQASWLIVLGVVCSATLYSLIGGYLLELANRRAYLLDRLRIAQLSVLRHNTEHLQRLATVDPLTRLPNRRHFEAELERLAAASAAARQPLALLILDIDHFKRFNDGYGHPAGDACLQRVGAALLQWARDGAPGTLAGSAPVPARIGGEEFGVLLPGCDPSTALAAAQHLRLRLRDLRIDHAHSPAGPFLTLSIGTASLVLDGAADARRLLKAADTALYRAKGMGRDQAAA